MMEGIVHGVLPTVFLQVTLTPVHIYYKTTEYPEVEGDHKDA